MSRSLLIYGAGGFAREILALVTDLAAAGRGWDVKGFLSDAPGDHGCELNGFPVLGGETVLSTQQSPPAVALGVGSPAAKRMIVDRCRAHGALFPALVHPTAVLSKRVELAEGVVITAGTILTTEIRMDSFAMLNLACTVGHDCLVGAYSSISPGVNISGEVTIGEGCDVGTGSSTVQGVSIGEWSIVGAGAVVTSDLPANCTAVGAPAKVIKQRDAGWHLK